MAVGLLQASAARALARRGLAAAVRRPAGKPLPAGAAVRPADAVLRLAHRAAVARSGACRARHRIAGGLLLPHPAEQQLQHQPAAAAALGRALLPLRARAPGRTRALVRLRTVRGALRIDEIFGGVAVPQLRRDPARHRAGAQCAAHALALAGLGTGTVAARAAPDLAASAGLP